MVGECEFVNSEFAKKVENNERYNYKISAAFANNAIAQGLDGVMYPTAVDEGKGFNVAIVPEVIDNNAVLEKVVVWRLIKRKKQIFIEPYLYADQFNPQNGNFMWKDTYSATPQWLKELKLNGK